MSVIEFLTNKNNKSELNDKAIRVFSNQYVEWADNMDAIVKYVGISNESVTLYI